MARGFVLNQFGNPDNVEAHYLTTGPGNLETNGRKNYPFCELNGHDRHHYGCFKIFKEQNPDIQIVGLQPRRWSEHWGIRRWPEEYLPTIFDRSRVGPYSLIFHSLQRKTMRKLARMEGISAGTSSGGAVWASLQNC